MPNAVDWQTLYVGDVCDENSPIIEDFGYCVAVNYLCAGSCFGCHGYESMPIGDFILRA